MAFPRKWHQDSAKIFVFVEADPEHVKYFSFVPASVDPKRSDGRNRRVIAGKGALNSDKAVPIEGEQNVDDGKIFRRIPVFHFAGSLVDCGEIVQ